uniref:Potassium channel domain-containing protein n=1 Tax=Plectus sambesii TaxID=2011161 RepID=A0A914UXP8_9BILA
MSTWTYGYLAIRVARVRVDPPIDHRQLLFDLPPTVPTTGCLLRRRRLLSRAANAESAVCCYPFDRALVDKLRTRLTNKYNISDRDYRVLEAIIVKSVPHKAGYQWKFSGAFYFCLTVMTTIGYGHSTPSTVGGKMFCMFYALAGIPLGLVMFQSIGERLNTFVAFVLRNFKQCMGTPGIPLGLVMFQSIGERLNTFVAFVLRNFKQCMGTPNPQVTHINLIVVASACGSLVMAAGAYVFHRTEGWELFDSLYYAFITLTTIGFGDYVALQKDGALQNQPQYVAFSLIFILFGLTIVSAAMNLLVLRFLTMNTEDERRDEHDREAAARGLVRVHGDIITSNGRVAAPAPGANLRKSSVVRRRPPIEVSSDDSDFGEEITEREAPYEEPEEDAASVCSCSCYQLPYSGVVRQRYTVTRRPGPVNHLLNSPLATTSDQSPRVRLGSSTTAAYSAGPPLVTFPRHPHSRPI